MKPFLLEGELIANRPLNRSYYLLEVVLPAGVWNVWSPSPGMFVQLKASAPDVFLRRPISIAYYDADRGVVGLLVQEVGKATLHWRHLPSGSHLSLLGPLGRGFTNSLEFAGPRPLLVGGGVGIAPIRMLAETFFRKGLSPTVFYGARSRNLLVFTEELRRYGRLFLATEDGSEGEKGYVTTLSAWQEEFTSIFTCGPRRMMEAVAFIARKRQIPCEISLENRMACGIGACLCCVENTSRGNVCVCTEGPVFNAKELLLPEQI